MFFHPCKLLVALCSAALAVVALCSIPTSAALMITDPNASYTIDFDSTVSGVNNGAYMGAGFSPTPGLGQLDSSAWATTGSNEGPTLFDGGPYTVDAHARGAAEVVVTFGGFWGFDLHTGAGVNRAFGIQPSGSEWAPGSLTLRLWNDSGAEITQFALAYEIHVRNDAPRSTSFKFSHSGDDITYAAIAALDFASPLVATGATWSSTPRSTTLTGLSIPDNSFYYLRWSGDEAGGLGVSDELALDDIVLSDFATASAPIPEPATLVLAGLAVLGLVGIARRRK